MYRRERETELLVALPTKTLELLLHGVLGLDLQYLGVLEMLVVSLLLLERLNGPQLLQEIPDLLFLDGEDATDDKRLRILRSRSLCAVRFCTGGSGRRCRCRCRCLVFILLVGSLPSILLCRLALGAVGSSSGAAAARRGWRHSRNEGTATVHTLLVEISQRSACATAGVAGSGMRRSVCANLAAVGGVLLWLFVQVIDGALVRLAV